MAGTLYGIGVGPGDWELVTLKALRIMGQCEVIAVPGADPRVSVAYNIAVQACPAIAQKEKLPISTPMNKKFVDLEENYAGAASQIEALLEQGKDVGLLTLGDPTIYSTYIYIHRRVKADGYEAEIISGIPSFCAVAARLGDSLVDRQEQLHVIPSSYQIAESLELPGTKVLMKAGSKLPQVRQTLLETSSRAVMVENCGMEHERIYPTAQDIPDTAGYFSLTIVKD